MRSKTKDKITKGTVVLWIEVINIENMIFLYKSVPFL